MTKETIEKLYRWICKHPQVLNSPLINGHINIKNLTTGKIIKQISYLFKYQ